MIGTQN